MPQTKKGSIPKINYDVQDDGVVLIAGVKISVKDWSEIVAYVDDHDAFASHKNKDFGKLSKKAQAGSDRDESSEGAKK